MIAKTRHIHDTKHLTGALPAIRYVEPEYCYMAVQNARASNAEIFVKEGDHVNCCQKIGVRHGPFSINQFILLVLVPIWVLRNTIIVMVSSLIF